MFYIGLYRENMKKSCLKPQGIELHFIRVYTICKGKKDLMTKDYNIFLKIIISHPYICTMDYPKFIVSNQKEESISIQKVNNYLD